MLTYDYDKNGNLIFTLDDREDFDEIYSENGDNDAAMFEIFEEVIANSELQWISPEEVGALTDAPLIGTYKSEDEVDEVYGFMEYQIIGPVERLKQNGKVIFMKG